jgi:hypothetical protein
MNHRKAKGVISGPRRRQAAVEVEVRNGLGCVSVKVSKGARESSEDLALTLRLDEARELLRLLQAACDREHGAQKKDAKALAELDRELAGLPED